MSPGLLLLFFNLFKIGIDDLIVLRLCATCLFRARSRFSLCPFLLGIHGFSKLMGSLSQFVGGFLDGFGVFTFHQFLEFSQFIFDVPFLYRINLVTELLQRLFGGVDQAVGVVARFDRFTLLLVFVGMGLGVTHHLVNLFLGQPGRCGDADRLLLAGTEILCGNMHDTVGIDVECHLDLGQAAWCRRDTGKFEVSECLVIAGHFTLTLQYMDRNRRLVVGCSREYLALAAGNGGVFLNQFGHDAAESLDTKRKRRDVQQQHVLDVASQNAPLNTGADGNDFIRVNTFVRHFAEDILNTLLNSRHTGHTAHQDNFIDLACGQSGVFQGGAAGAFKLRQQLGTDRLQLGARKFQGQMLRTGSIGGDERKVDVGFYGGGKFALGLFSSLFKTLESHLVAAQINALVFLELVGDPVDNQLVEVLTTQECIAVGGLDFKYSVTQLQDRNIERTTAQVEYGDFFVFFLVKSVCQGCCGRLVNDTQHVQSGNLAGVLGCLALGVIEVGRHGDNRIGDGGAKIILGGLFHFLQDHRRNFRSGIALAAHLYPGIAVVGLDNLERRNSDVFFNRFRIKLAPDQAFDGVEGVLRIGDRLTLGLLTYQPLAAVGNGDHRGCRPSTFGVGNNDRLTTLHD